LSNQILVFYGSYRSDRMGIRLAEFLVERLRRRGDAVELIDAKAVNLPMLDRMYKEYPQGAAPEPLEQLAGKIRDADGFVFITGEYNWGVQPGLKNLTDHFLEEWFWRPAAIASYSAGRFSGARAATAWHGTLSEMGMVVVSSTIAVGPIGQTLAVDGAPIGEGGKALELLIGPLIAVCCQATSLLSLLSTRHGGSACPVGAGRGCGGGASAADIRLLAGHWIDRAC
jgi:NAD(P)H-dependent FMN reductase